MLFASRAIVDLETEVRQLRDKLSLQESCHQRLRDEMDSRIVNLQTEWRQYLASCEDVFDKIDHLTKRRAKRKSRDSVEAQPVNGPSEAETPRGDAVTARVLERRNARAVRTQNVPG